MSHDRLIAPFPKVYRARTVPFAWIGRWSTVGTRYEHLEYTQISLVGDGEAALERFDIMLDDPMPKRFCERDLAPRGN